MKKLFPGSKLGQPDDKFPKKPIQVHYQSYQATNIQQPSFLPYYSWCILGVVLEFSFNL